MSTSQRDDVDYPYSPKPAAVLLPRGRTSDSPAMPRRSWRFLGKWLLRLASAAAVMMAIALIPVGIVGYRARSQAAAIERLESLGCRVDYLGQHLYSGLSGRWQNYVREKFGPEHFGDVFLVSAVGLDPSVDASQVCDLCSRFDRLEHFAIGSQSFRFDQIARWKQLDNLNHLTIDSPTLTDADLVRIGQMPRLNTLDLNAPKVTSAGLHHLNGAAELSVLVIDSAALDGSGAANEAGLPKLKNLTIYHSPQLRDAGIVNLGPMPELTHVTFTSSTLGDVAIKHVARGGKLYSATLSGTKITDQGLESLANGSELFSLELVGTQVSDAGVAALAACQNLNDLNVAETKVTGKGLSVLSGNNLTLRMDKCTVTDESLRDVLKVPGLADLSLEDTNVTGAGLGDLLATTSLFRINLAGTTLTREGVQSLAKSKIPSIHLARTGIDDNTLMLFADSNTISELDVRETKVTKQGVKSFYEARKKRLAAAGREESLILTCDHPEIAQQYLPDSIPFTGDFPSPEPDGSLPPDSSEPPPDAAPTIVNPN